MHRVVITGLGVVSPIGNNLSQFWQNLCKGTSGSARITKFDPEKFKTQFACEVKEFNPKGVIERKDLRKFDLYTQYALVVADEALKQSGLGDSDYDPERVGVIWGAGDGGVSTFEEQLKEFHLGNGTPRFNPFFIPKRIVNIASGVISIHFGFKGVSFTTAAACSASNNAIIDAYNYIRWGQADIMVAGGSEASITPSSIGGFNAARTLSTFNEEPQKASRPFDINRDGFVLGEGGAALILESLESAKARNATILAEIAGGAMASDAYHLTGTHPEGEGAERGMRLALKDAGLTMGEIDYINAHATSTPVGDISELKAITSIFKGHPNLNISATKSMTGHLLGGAGAVEAVASIMAVINDLIPPTINTKDIEPEFKDLFDYSLTRLTSKPVRYALNNTFGFGGHIACSIFKKYEG